MSMETIASNPANYRLEEEARSYRFIEDDEGTSSDDDVPLRRRKWGGGGRRVKNVPHILLSQEWMTLLIRRVHEADLSTTAKNAIIRRIDTTYAAMRKCTIYPRKRSAVNRMRDLYYLKVDLLVYIVQMGRHGNVPMRELYKLLAPGYTGAPGLRQDMCILDIKAFDKLNLCMIQNYMDNKSDAFTRLKRHMIIEISMEARWYMRQLADKLLFLLLLYGHTSTAMSALTGANRSTMRRIGNLNIAIDTFNDTDDRTRQRDDASSASNAASISTSSSSSPLTNNNDYVAVQNLDLDPINKFNNPLDVNRCFRETVWSVPTNWREQRRRRRDAPNLKSALELAKSIDRGQYPYSSTDMRRFCDLYNIRSFDNRSNTLEILNKYIFVRIYGVFAKTLNVALMAGAANDRILITRDKLENSAEESYPVDIEMYDTTTRGIDQHEDFSLTDEWCLEYGFRQLLLLHEEINAALYDRAFVAGPRTKERPQRRPRRGRR